MSATAAPAPPTTPPRVARRLELATTGEPDVLPRVLTWLRRHGCALTRIDYHAADRHGPGRFVVAVDAPRRHADRLACGLGNLVGVTEVQVD
jgi:hypothetical protein